MPVQDGPDIFRADAARLLARAPLAARMRPRTLDEFAGQEQLVGPGTVLRRVIESDRLGSFVLWGPPGSGKTTLARIVAGQTRAHFVPLSAVSAGVADVRRTIAEASDRLALNGRRTILFIDEIHRFNRAQQDALLPAVEEGTVYLIGATTENPYFEVNSALVSRCRVLRLEPLGAGQVRAILGAALADAERGLAHLAPKIAAEALDHLVAVAGGDARVGLNALEAAVESAQPDELGVRLVTLETAAAAVGRRALQHDRSGDNHYDVVSALIKSMRGSDPDAAVYWLARMIEAGEDPVFIARRIVVCAAEDVGLADPAALGVAVAAAQAAAMVGLPEARLPLAEAAIYVACAPKSNACCLAIDAALGRVRERGDSGVPMHLRNAAHPGLASHGHGVGYKYPHNYPGHVTAQQYLPDDVAGTTYYRPTDCGDEDGIARRLERWRELTNPAAGDSMPPGTKSD